MQRTFSIFACLILTIALALSAALTGHAGSAAQAPLKITTGTIIAMGDSLTAGLGLEETEAYPALLERKLAAAGHPLQVINAGVSGETSSGALSRVAWLLTLKPALVILETGANDGFRAIPPKVLEDNLDRIITELKAAGVAVVLCGMQMVPNLGPEYVEAFGRIYPRLAEKHNLVYMPFFLKDVATRPDLNQPDGIHPNAEGHRIIAENLYPYVIQALGRL